MMINNPNTAQVKSAQKRNLMLLTVLVGVGLMALLYVLSDHTTNSSQVPTKAEKSKFTNPLDHLDAESVVLEMTQKELRDTKKQTSNIQQKLDSLSNEKMNQDELVHKSNDELIARVTALEKQLTAQGSPVLTGAATSMSGSTSYQGNYLSAAGGVPNQVSMGGGIREDKLTLSPRNTDTKKQVLKNPDTFVPAGSFVTAIMLSGADASAAVNSQSNPEPMVLRLTSNGVLPNKKRSHLKDCFVTAAVIGDISSERGKIRLERLSCTFPNGETVEQEVDGTIIGSEGKNGVRGIPLWRDGAITQRAFGSGFLSGVANGFSNSYNTNSISAQGTVQTLNSGKIIQNGLANGSAKGMDKLSDFYIRLAEQYHPVIQLSAGTIVDVLFLKGFFLDGKKHEDKNLNVDNFAINDMNSPTLFPAPPTDAQSLPLSTGDVKRIQENSKELGLRVTPTTIAS
jgi:conjugal transfer pilus assembly protein TraB